jgi:hypothetical protein
MAPHVTNQELAGYIYQPTSKDFAFVKQHIAECETCRISYEQMQAITSQLKSARKLDLPRVDETHLTDEQIIAYAHGQLDHNQRNDIQGHLDNCGNCMKAVLRYRAYLAEYESTKLGQETKNNVTELPQQPRQKPQPLRFALPLAAAASVIFAVLVVLQWQTSKTPDQLASGEGSITPDVIQPEIVGTTTPPQSSVIPASNQTKGPVNWYGGYVETTAVGTADMNKMKNRVQAEIVAEKTARHLAYSQLAEILKGIQVTASSTYEDLLLKVDSLNIQSEGFIQGAQVVNKNITWVDDAPKATVTVRAPLFGQNSLKNIIQAEAKQAVLEQPAEEISINPSANDMAAQYSNVIIDASGIDFSPALFTRLESTDNQSVLTGGNAIDLNYMYYASLESAKASNFAGQSPVVIKARANSRPGTLVLDNADAQLTHVISQKQISDPDKPMLVVF